jgi:hypothetical protein
MAKKSYIGLYWNLSIEVVDSDMLVKLGMPSEDQFLSIKKVVL